MGTSGARESRWAQMFRCERCGTGFNATVAAALEGCPRCRTRDGVSAEVSFRLFEPRQLSDLALGTDRLGVSEANGAGETTRARLRGPAEPVGSDGDRLREAS